MLKQITKIMDLKAEEQEEVIQNLLLATPKIGKSNNLPTDDLIGALLLNVIREIKEFYLSEKKVFIANDNNKNGNRQSQDKAVHVPDSCLENRSA